MYITDDVYKSLVITGVAVIQGGDDPWVRDLKTKAPIRLRASFLEAVATYKLIIAHIAFGNVFVKAIKGSRVNGY